MGLEYQEPEARVSNGRGAGVAYRCFEFRRTRAGLSRMNLKSRTAFKLFESWISLVTCSFAVAVVLAGEIIPAAMVLVGARTEVVMPVMHRRVRLP